MPGDLLQPTLLYETETERHRDREAQRQRDAERHAERQRQSYTLILYREGTRSGAGHLALLPVSPTDQAAPL